MKDQTHEQARAIVEFYLISKGREIFSNNFVEYHPIFVKKHRLDNRFKGHSFDIWTNEEIIEIDDYDKHSKTNQKINDGIVNDYREYYLPQWKYHRLQKEEIVDSKGHLQPSAADYLRKNLF